MKLNPQNIFKYIICQYYNIKKSNFDEYFHKSFIDIGGTSILAMQIINEFEQLSNINFPHEAIEMLFDKNITLRNVNTFLKKINYTLCVNNKNCSNVEIHKPVDELMRNFRKMSILWKYNMKACIDASPILINLTNKELLAVGSHSHIFSVIDIENGNCISESKLSNRVESTACLTPCQQYVIVGCYDGFVYCINVTSGEIKWKYKTKDRVKCIPVLCQNNTAVVIGSYDKNIHCFNIEHGKRIWKINVEGSITASPLVNEKFIYIATILGHCFCLKEYDGSIKWHVNVKVPIFGSACAFKKNGLFLVVWPDVKGNIHFLNSNNGENICNFIVDGMIYSSLIYYDEKIYFGSHNKYLYCICLDDDQCDVVFKIKFGSEIFASPCLHLYENKLYCIVACSDGNIYMIDVKKLNVVSSIQLTGDVFSTPVLYKNKLYIGCRDDFIYCIDIFSKNSL